MGIRVILDDLCYRKVYMYVSLREGSWLSYLGLRMLGESSLALHPKSYYLKVKRTLGQLVNDTGQWKKARVQGSLGSEPVAAQISAIPVLHLAEGKQATQPSLQSCFLGDFQFTVKLRS